MKWVRNDRTPRFLITLSTEAHSASPNAPVINGVERNDRTLGNCNKIRT